jgi:hypothetical protein
MGPRTFGIRFDPKQKCAARFGLLATRASARGSRRTVIITTTPDDITAGTVDITTAGTTAGNLRRIWCLLHGSWALDPLNAFAVAGPVMNAHDEVLQPRPQFERQHNTRPTLEQRCV